MGKKVTHVGEKNSIVQKFCIPPTIDALKTRTKLPNYSPETTR